MSMRPSCYGGSLRKYDCRVVTTSCDHVIILSLGKKGISPATSFRAGAAMENLDVCCRAIEAQGNWNRNKLDDKVTDLAKLVKHGNPGRPVFEPQSMPLTMWRELLLEYVWALWRTWSNGGNLKERAAEFRKIMETLRGPSDRLEVDNPLT